MANPRTIYKEEHELFRKTVKAFIDREIAPHYERWEKEGQVSREVWRKAGEAGLLLTDMPEEYGGGGADFLYSAVMIEEMAKRVLRRARLPPALRHRRALHPQLRQRGAEAHLAAEDGQGRGDHRHRHDRARHGQRPAGDPHHGAAQGQRAGRQRAEDLHHQRRASPISSSSPPRPTRRAGAKGVTLVLVETDRPGFKRGRNLKKIGQNAQDTAELFFEDVRVPPSNILGEEGRGFACLMNQLPRERLLVAIGAVAIMEAALQWTIDYTRERKAFGKAIAEFQNTRFKLAEVKTEVTVARVFLDHCLELFLAGELDATTAAMSKWWLTELDNKVLDTCLQLFGGYGYMLEYPIARAYADARVHRIYAGTTEIMKELVARSL